MKLRQLKYPIGLILAVIILVSLATPLFAIADPNYTRVDGMAVFTNVSSTGDQLWVCRYSVNYTTLPTDSASSSFMMAIYTNAGVATGYTVNLNYYGFNLISIYLTSAQALTWSGAYTVKIMGNPAKFPILTENINMASRALSASDWYQGTSLQSWLTTQVQGLQSDLGQSLISSSNILTTAGASLVLAAIPNINQIIPNFFSATTYYPTPTSTTYTGAGTTNYTGHMGSDLPVALTDIATWLGIGTGGVASGWEPRVDWVNEDTDGLENSNLAAPIASASGKLGVFYQTQDAVYTITMKDVLTGVTGDAIINMTDGFIYPDARRTFYGAGRYWMFFYDHTPGDVGFTSSADGVAWLAKVSLNATLQVSASDTFSVYFDGTYIHWAMTPSAPYNNTIYYRRGLPVSDGTITWSTAQQSISITGVYDCSVIADSSGYPWIGYHPDLGGEVGAYPYVTKSSTNNGTWATAAGFPYQLTNVGNDDQARAWPVALSGGKVYVVYNQHGTQPLKGKLWNGSSWSAEENVATLVVGYPGAKSILAIDDDVHFVYIDGVGKITYLKRTYATGWSTPLVLDTIGGFSWCAISKDDEDLYVFYNGSAPLSVDHIYYLKYTEATGNPNWIGIIMTTMLAMIMGGLAYLPSRSPMWAMAFGSFALPVGYWIGFLNLGIAVMIAVGLGIAFAVLFILSRV